MIFKINSKTNIRKNISNNHNTNLNCIQYINASHVRIQIFNFFPRADLVMFNIQYNATLRDDLGV